MKLELVRYGHGWDTTLGRLFIDGAPMCFTLEDEHRTVKVPAETRIPNGEYRITFRAEGGFHARYAKLYPDMHRGMLWIRDVPGFEFVLIHQGNKESDTAGCVLVGRSPYVGPDGEFEVGGSALAYKTLYPIVSKPLLAKESVTVVVSSRS